MHGNGDGQIFALIVMVVAACEVAVGLGLIVAHLPAASCRSTSTSCGSSRDERPSAWIVLLAPLAGFLLIAFTAKVLPWRAHGWIGTLAIATSFGASLATLAALEGRGEEERQVVSVAWDYAVAGGWTRSSRS